jgi:uncharacterized membrane protein YkoI
MTIGKRIYWVVALVAVMALAGAAVTLTARLTSAGGPTPTPAVQTSGQQDEADDAGEHAAKGPDTDTLDEQSGPQDQADEASQGTDTVVPCSNPASADNDAAEAQSGPDADNIEDQCGDQNEAADGTEPQQSGVLDDGKDLLPQAQITVDQAIAAGQSAASGPVGEIDLEQAHGRLVFNVDIGDKDVKVDASNGSIVTVDSDD